jgi:hypothetical protein
MVTIDNYNIINTYATIFAAIGTISAVILSLYFAYSSRKIALKIHTGIYQGSQDNKDFILIKILNKGNRAVTISEHFVLEFGFFWKKNVIIGFKNIDCNQSSKFPCKLYEGDEAVIIIPIEQSYGNYLENFYKNFLINSPIININTLKLQIYPNLGNTIKIKLDKSIKNAIHGFRKTNKTSERNSLP